MVFLLSIMSKRRTDLVKAIKEKGKSLEAEMSFFDHLDVLRGHLIAIFTFTILVFVFYDFIFEDIIMAPGRTDFWTYRMMCLATEKFNLGAEFCVQKLSFNIINTELGGQFMLQINSSMMIGIVLGVPYLLYELWRFVKPALHDEERKSATGFVFWSSMLFISGLLFGYFIIAPLSINFLTNYEVSEIINNQIMISSYFSVLATLTLGAGIAFELPVVIYILSKLGVMTPTFMRATRRYAIVIILIIAAVVTPTPDLITMLTVSFPLFLLYELSIYISAVVERRKLKAEKEFYES
jgi:sec-independent protein translocase protein TatC